MVSLQKNVLQKSVFRRIGVAMSLLLLGLCSQLATAQTLPVQVDVAGDVATARIGNPMNPLAELTLTFEDASGLSPASLGISAQLVSLNDPVLLARLPSNLTSLQSALPLLVTIEPPASGGLSFRRTGRFELHTHALPYITGSSLRVLKAPVGGSFRDVTEEIAQGSVRARSRYGGFSQFLVVLDVRETSAVVAEKTTWLRARVATLPPAERPVFDAQIDAVQAAVAGADYDTAIAAAQDIADRAHARAGTHLAEEWRATRDADNQAGELIAGALTLRFSLAYLRDFGE